MKTQKIVNILKIRKKNTKVLYKVASYIDTNSKNLRDNNKIKTNKKCVSNKLEKVINLQNRIITDVMDKYEKNKNAKHKIRNRITMKKIKNLNEGLIDNKNKWNKLKKLTPLLLFFNTINQKRKTNKLHKATSKSQYESKCGKNTTESGKKNINVEQNIKWKELKLLTNNKKLLIEYIDLKNKFNLNAYGMPWVNQIDKRSITSNSNLKHNIITKTETNELNRNLRKKIFKINSFLTNKPVKKILSTFLTLRRTKIQKQTIQKFNPRLLWIIKKKLKRNNNLNDLIIKYQWKNKHTNNYTKKNKIITFYGKNKYLKKEFNNNDKTQQVNNYTVDPIISKQLKNKVSYETIKKHKQTNRIINSNAKNKRLKIKIIDKIKQSIKKKIINNTVKNKLKTLTVGSNSNKKPHTFNNKKTKIFNPIIDQEQQIHKIKIKQIFFANFNYKLIYERKRLELNKVTQWKRKSEPKRYLACIFYKEFKKQKFKIENHVYRNFLKYTKFFALNLRNFKQTFVKDETQPAFFTLDMHTKKNSIRGPNVYQFIFQRRNHKEGFYFWQNYNTNWLYYNLVKNKTVRFYFTPIRIKRQINKKKLKYLNPYKRFQIKHPRVGQWATIGLVGNYMARNTLFVKQKILFYIFSTFYRITNRKYLRYINRKFIKIYSKFHNHMTLILKNFEQRLDVLIFRAGIAINMDLARILIRRGYISVNFIIKKNIAFYTQIQDFISITQNMRNTIKELKIERYESFRKIYLNRFYKQPYMNTMSMYISTILTSITQMIGKPLWIKTYAKIKNFLNEYKLWTPSVVFKTIQDLRINTPNKIKTKKKNQKINWIWLRKENSFFRDKFQQIKHKINVKKYNTLKQIYKNELTKLRIIKRTKTQQNKNLQTKKRINLQIFNLVTKDLLVQTWETFPKNLLINTQYRYFIIIQHFEGGFQKKTNTENRGRLDMKQINWLVKNI
jgi:hypothetical protein